MKKVYNIKDRFSHELNEIAYVLQNLENDRYYEKSGVPNDGYLATNIAKLRKKLNDLLNKIEYNKDSDIEHMAKEISKYDINKK